MKLYIIVYCGYEGIEEIKGIFDKETAIKTIRELKDSIEDKKEKDRWCVQRAELNCNGGIDCCCEELGIPPSQAWIY